NKGRDRQRNTRVQVVSQELGIDRISDFIDLEDATRSRNDNDFSDSWSLTIPSNQRVGTYVLNGFVYFRDDRNRDASERVERTITVRDCSEPTSPSTQPNQQQNQTDSFVITPPQTETPVTSGTPVTARPVQVQQETDWLLIGLGVLAFILVLVIVYLFVVIVRK
ncbi:MAG: hypothetical protein ACMXYC_03890, partial [Candidatus Woesearchaeota archaeon]